MWTSYHMLSPTRKHIRATKQPGRQNDSASRYQQSVNDHCRLAYGVTEQGAHCSDACGSQFYGTGFWEKRVLLQGQKARRQAGLKSVSKICELFKLFQVSEDGWVCWRFPLEGFGTRPFMVKVVKGLWHSIFWFNQSFASERDLTFKFWSYSGPLVPRERWNFGRRYSVKIAPLHKWLLHDLCICSVFLNKKLSIQVRNKIGSVRAGSAVTIGSWRQAHCRVEVDDMHGPNSLVTKSDLTNTVSTCQQQRLMNGKPWIQLLR